MNRLAYYLALALIGGWCSAPMAADSLANWSYAPLQDDLPITRMLGMDVYSISERPIGKVRNVMLDADGNFESVSVEFSHADGEAFALAAFEWSDISVEPAQGKVTVAVGMQGRPVKAPANIVGTGGDVRKLLGRPVILAGEDFGEVSDVLFEPGSSTPTALVVESHRGKVYALPLPTSLSTEPVTYSFSAEQLQELDEFSSES